MDNFISLVEKIERHKLTDGKSIITIANYIRKLAYDNSKWTTLLGTHSESLPDGILTPMEKQVLTKMVTHRFAGQQELGVVHTAYGNVALGEVILGICAGLERNILLQLPQIYKITPRPIDSLYLATIAGRLGFTGLVNKANPSVPLFGPAGTWSPSSQCPQIYNADMPSYSKATDAQILGSIDGFLLGYRIAQWNSQRTNVRLGRLLRMYYKNGVSYNKHDKQFAACKRLDTFKKFAQTSMLVEQVELACYAVKNIWNQGHDLSKVQNSGMLGLAKDTVSQFDARFKQLQSKFNCPPEDKEDCYLPANLVFIMDESGSIGSANYPEEKEFVKNIIQAFAILSYTTRVAVVEYSDDAEETIKLGEYISKSTLMCAVDDLQYSGGATATSKALKVGYGILKESQSKAGPKHSNDPQIMILLTDGQSNGGMEVLRPIVQSIKKNITGLTMVAVGVGNYAIDELELIATNSTKHVLTTKRFSELINLVKQLRKQTCKTSTTLRVDNDEEGEGQAKKDHQVVGYVTPSNARYFTLPPETLAKAENISIEIKSSFGSVILYGSRTNASPGPDVHDFKFSVNDALLRQRRSTDSSNKKGKSLEFYNICKGYSSSTCPPLYLAVYGENSTNSCSDPDCSVPDQIKFEITAAQIVKVERQEKTCFFNVTADQILNAAEVTIEILPLNESVTLYTSRYYQNPDQNNHNETLTVTDGEKGRRLVMNEPCKGFMTCPPIYVSLTGYDVNCNCNQDNTCSVPSQVKITVKQFKPLTTSKPKTTAAPKASPTTIHCFYNISSQKLNTVKSVNIKITANDSAIEMFVSRTHKPNKSNFTERLVATVGNVTEMELLSPCSGFEKCLPLYLVFAGARLSCNCATDGNERNCELPDNVKITFTEKKPQPSKGASLEISFSLVTATLLLSRLCRP